MDLLSPVEIKKLLLKHNAGPNKTLGQNFLIDRNVLEKVVSAGDIKNSDTILEVGPGLGTLTKELATKAGKVVAIEKDPKMLEILKETLAEFKNVEIIQGDILKLPVPSLRERSEATDEAISKPVLFSEFKNYKVVANIPYYLTSPLIRQFLETENPPEEIVLTIQKEVAQRICSVSPKMSLLSVSVQFYADAKIASYVSKNCFWPAPKVDSAIIKITPRQQSNPNAELFFKIVKAGFSHPRKQLAGNLASNLKITKKEAENWLLQNSVQPAQRAETLSVGDWENLTKTFPKTC